jgi:putative cell wall-binding protein
MANLIEEFNEIPELHTLRHKHDTVVTEQGYDYQDKLLSNSLSPVLYQNENNNIFLEKLNKMMVALVESILPTRNLFFYSHSKYFNRHGK